MAPIPMSTKTDETKNSTQSAERSEFHSLVSDVLIAVSL